MADKITIKGDKVHLANGSGTNAAVGIPQFVENVGGYSLQGLNETPFVDNLKWQVSCGVTTICILEFKPELRWLKWITEDSPVPYGPGVKSKDRKLATPYVVVQVPFRQGRLVPRIQLFYRNEPLRKINGDGGMLNWPNLLNISPNVNHCLTWCCTQFLNVEAIPPGITAGLEAVASHLWGGELNLSSEMHEHASTHSKAIADGIDARVTDVERWEQESQKNPEFILSVEWKSTDNTVEDVILRELKSQKVKPRPTTVAELATLALRKRKPK